MNTLNLSLDKLYILTYTDNTQSHGCSNFFDRLLFKNKLFPLELTFKDEIISVNISLHDNKNFLYTTTLM